MRRRLLTVEELEPLAPWEMDIWVGTGSKLDRAKARAAGLSEHIIRSIEAAVDQAARRIFGLSANPADGGL